MKTFKIAALSLLALLMALFALPAGAQGNTAKVRVIHASPDAPAVDIYVDGQKVAALTNVPFFTASPYLDLPAGSRRIQVAPTGQPASAAVIDATATIEAGKAYTIAATGPVASIKATILSDNLAAPAAGKAHVRVVHFSPDAPAVDVKVKGGATLIPGLAFPQASNYLPVDAGSYDLQVTPAGGDAVVIDLPGTALEAGKIYDVFATGPLASIKPQVAVTTPAAAPAPAAGGQPAQLPTTAEGEGLPFAALATLAVLMLATGALVLRRRAS